METFENNEVHLTGTVVEELTFSHEVFGERFYTFELSMRRLNDKTDVIPIVVSERASFFNQIRKDEYLEIKGKYRSYNLHEENNTKLILTVFANDICVVDPYENDINKIYLDGFICKPVIYRTTPLERQIADVLVAVNRPYGKSDYIPCITWGGNAVKASLLSVGDEIEISGRIQSREYEKKIAAGKRENRVAYEVSCSEIKRI